MAAKYSPNSLIATKRDSSSSSSSSGSNVSDMEEWKPSVIQETTDGTSSNKMPQVRQQTVGKRDSCDSSKNIGSKEDSSKTKCNVIISVTHSDVPIPEYSPQEQEIPIRFLRNLERGKSEYDTSSVIPSSKSLLKAGERDLISKKSMAKSSDYDDDLVCDDDNDFTLSKDEKIILNDLLKYLSSRSKHEKATVVLKKLLAIYYNYKNFDSYLEEKHNRLLQESIDKNQEISKLTETCKALRKELSQERIDKNQEISKFTETRIALINENQKPHPNKYDCMFENINQNLSNQFDTQKNEYANLMLENENERARLYRKKTVWKAKIDQLNKIVEDMGTEHSLERISKDTEINKLTTMIESLKKELSQEKLSNETQINKLMTKNGTLKQELLLERISKNTEKENLTAANESLKKELSQERISKDTEINKLITMIESLKKEAAQSGLYQFHGPVTFNPNHLGDEFKTKSENNIKELKEKEQIIETLKNDIIKLHNEKSDLEVKLKSYEIQFVNFQTAADLDNDKNDI